MDYIISSGEIGSGIILNNYDSMTVFDGGTAFITSINSGGDLSVLSGGIANETTINNGGDLFVSFGGSADNTTVKLNGNMIVFSGGLTDNTRITNQGRITVNSGGTALNVFVDSGSNYYSLIFSIAPNTYITGKVAGSAFEIKNGMVSNFTAGNGSLFISSGGTADQTTVNVNGGIHVSSSGTINHTTINTNGWTYVSSGGTANSTVIKSDGRLYVLYNGMVNNTIVDSWGSLYISRGGMANDTTVNIGQMFISSGGYASNVLLLGQDDRGEGDVFVSGGGIVEDVTIGDYGDYYVSSGGTAIKTTVNSTGNMEIYSGGTATEIIENGGCVKLDAGAQATFLANTFSGLVLSGWSSFNSGYVRDSASVHSGTTAFNTEVFSAGDLTVFSGGTANDTIVNSGGTLTISSGGTATVVFNPWKGSVVSKKGADVTYLERDANIYYGGGLSGIISKTDTIESFNIETGKTAILYSGGYAIKTTVRNNGLFRVSSGGSADNTTVSSGGSMCVSNGGVANDTKISGGNLQIISNGIAYDTTAYGNGSLTVLSGGIADSVKTYAGGSVKISRGGILTGKMSFLAGAIFSVENGAVINFDLTRMSADEKAILNDWSLIQGTPDYVIKVKGNQETGIYKLADAADDFAGTITVKNTGGESLGTLTVGETITVEDMDYSLNLIDGTLSMRIDSSSVPTDLTFFPGDFIGNRKSILAVADEPHVTIYRNKGIVWSELTLDDECEIAGVGDFNGDGADDFLTVHSSGLVIGELSDGYGEFDSQVLNYLNEGWDILGVGDFNGNGSDDVLIANPTGASETVGLLGFWESGTTWTLINGYSAEWECVATGDYNGDGKCDMLWRNQFEGEGGLTYNAYCTWIVDDPVDWRMVSVANPDEWNFLCSGDFDGDKMNDIAMINDVGVVGIWGVNDGWLSSWSILSAVTNEWQLAGVADFNGDGTDDIAWCNTDTGLVGCWQIKNKELAGWQTIANIG